MARVPQYVQNKLASSITPVVVDNSAAQLTEQLNNNVGKIAQSALALSVKKQKEVDEINARIKSVNDTLTAYDRTIAIENQLYDIIDEEKSNNIDNPQLAVKNIEQRGRDLIADEMSKLSDTTDLAVKEKMGGIITNSFRGKLSELHSWQISQDTANAQSKVDSMIGGLCTRVNKSSDVSTLAKCLDFANQKDINGKPLSDSIKMAYGTKGEKKIKEAQEEIAKAYVFGLLDRKSPKQVNAILNSGALDNYLSPADQHSLRNMAKTMVNAQQSAAKRDSFFEIYNIKENATLLAASGEYTPSMYEADKKRIRALGGKASDYNVILAKQVSSDKTASKRDFAQKQIEAHDKVISAWAKISGKTGKISANAELEDIIKFQNLVEENRPYFTGEQYDNYMIKLSKSRVKRIKDMRTDIWGNPQGVLKGDDEISKGYNQIFKYTKENYKNDDNKRIEATNDMVGEFIKRVERTETNNGKPLTEGERQSIITGIINRQAQKSNPYLQNLPKEGKLFKDKTTGKVIRLYPDGRREVIKE